VTSPGDGPDQDDARRVDPAYEALFREDDEAHESIAPDPTPEAAPEPPAEAVPAAVPEVGVDTGRLFRSQGVEGHPETVLALETGRFTRLKTLERTSVEMTPVPDPSDSGADPEVASLIGADPAAGVSMSGREPRAGRTRQPRTLGARSARGITGVAVAIIVIGVTVLVGLANAMLGDGILGWPTGIALLASSTYAAIAVRRSSDTIAFLMPPVAFLLATVTVGQAFLGPTKASLLGRAEVTFTTLGTNWVWIIGSTIVALVIVLVRRRR